MKEVLIVVKRPPSKLCLLLLAALLLTACSGGGGGSSLYGVSGRVTDQYGEPVPDVKVAADGELRDEAKTTADGYYELTPLKGITTVTAQKEGWVFDGPKKVSGPQVVNFSGSHSSYRLTVTVIGQGRVQETVMYQPQGSYYQGTEVQLRAIPDVGSKFLRWEGDVTGTSNPVTIVMDGPKEVTAVFEGSVPASVSGTIGVVHNFPWSAVDTAQFSAASQNSEREKARTSSFREEDFEPTELIIAFEESVSPEEQREILAKQGYEILDSISLLNAYLVRRADQDVERGALQALSLPGVKYATPNTRMYALSVTHPNDEYYGLQWHYRQIRLPQAWSVTRGSRSIRIAVVDTGVSINHPDLAGRLDTAFGYNFVNPYASFDDDNGHGTHVAGTIGALTNNGIGVAGVMWDVEILPVKVLAANGEGSVFDVANGILYAAGLLDYPVNPYPADVINLSLGGSAPDWLTEEAVRRVIEDGSSIIVAAAGNKGTGSVYYPAAYDGVIAVGAVDFNYPYEPKKATYSNYGFRLDVVAPGGDMDADSDWNGNWDGVLSAYPSGYRFLEGTSMAAPHVSGVIGLMLANGVPRSRVRDVLVETAIPLGGYDFSIYTGYGLVNAYWAVNAVDKMRIIVGTREGSVVYPVAETSISPRGGSFTLDVPPGEYILMAWIDVRPGSDVIEPGDYFNESWPFVIEGGELRLFEGSVFEVDYSSIASLSPNTHEPIKLAQ
jgi:serine protease